MAQIIEMKVTTEDGVYDGKFTKIMGEEVPSMFFVASKDDWSVNELFQNALEVMEYLEGKDIIEKTIAEMENTLEEGPDDFKKFAREVMGEENFTTMIKVLADTKMRKELAGVLSNCMLLILLNLRKGEYFLPQGDWRVFAL